MFDRSLPHYQWININVVVDKSFMSICPRELVCGEFRRLVISTFWPLDDRSLTAVNPKGFRTNLRRQLQCHTLALLALGQN